MDWDQQIGDRTAGASALRLGRPGSDPVDNVSVLARLSTSIGPAKDSSTEIRLKHTHDDSRRSCDFGKTNLDAADFAIEPACHRRLTNRAHWR